MQAPLLKVLAILLLVSYASGQFQAAPALTSAAFGSFATATKTYRTSKRLEVLEFVTAATDPTFTYTVYNSSVPSTKLNTQTVTTTGGNTWTIEKITTDTLSCALVKQDTANTLNLLKFESQNSAPTVIASANHPITIANLATVASLGQNCVGAYIGATPVLKIFSNPAAVIPTGWVRITKSESLAYGVATGASTTTVYRINPTTGVFTAIYTINKVYEAFLFKTVPNRLILTGVAKTNTPADGDADVNVNQTFFVISDPAVGNATLLGQFDILATVTPVVGSNVADANRYLVNFEVSPAFTKFVTVYKAVGAAANARRVTLFKNIDWSRNTVSDVTIKDQTKFGQTTSTLSATNTDFAISDNFFLLNNRSIFAAAVTGPPAIPATPIVEDAYQFVGNVLTFFRQRPITGASPEQTGLERIIIDSAFATELQSASRIAVTDGYAFTINGYFNLASTTRPSVTNTAFLTFTIPTGTPVVSAPANALGWVYKKITPLVPATTGATPTPEVPASTASNLFRFTPTTTGNFITKTETQTGSVSVLAVNDICHIEKNNEAASYKVIFRTASNATPPVLTTTDITVTPLLTALTLTGTWILADNCEKFAVGGAIFYLNTAKTAYVLFPGITQAFTALDQNINVGIVGNEVYALVPGTTYTIAKIFTYNGTFLTNTRIFSLDSNKVVITSTSTSTARVLAYNVNTGNGAFTNVMTYQDAGYSDTPTVYVSPQLTKIFITGPIAAAPNQKYNGFHVDYTNGLYVNITLPTLTVTTFSSIVLTLADQFLYFKQDSERIFAFIKDVTTLQISFSTISIADINKAVFYTDSNGRTSFLIVSTSASTVTVRQYPVSMMQAILNSQLTTTVGPSVVAIRMNSAGRVWPCGIGCLDCSTGECTSCMTGFNYDSNVKVCTPCPPGCSACVANPQVCDSCVAGTIKSGTTCVRCNSACATCTGSLISECATCALGRTKTAANLCIACPRNCATCDNTGNTCLTCFPGFIISGGKCNLGCSAFCATCDSSNIFTCTGCGNGLFLLNSKCMACPANCVTCSDANTCTSCVTGMTPNSNNKCILNCQLPCFTCADNQPTVCLSCYAGTNLTGTTCVFDTTCNGTVGTCTDCGQGLNLYLDSSKKCVSCPNITNCIQCSTTAFSSCALCATGYFVDSSSGCTQCPTACTSCLSTIACTTCAAGYTIISGNTGTCVACSSPCATCQGAATQCLSCIDGHTKQSWRCVRNRRVEFVFVMGGTVANFVAVVADFQAFIIAKLPFESSDNADVVLISSAVAGSTIVSGSVIPTDASVSSSTVTGLLSSIPSGTTFGTGASAVTVTSASFSASGESSSTTSDNAALIVGLVVGLTLGITVIVLIIVIVAKKKAATSIGQVSSGELHVQVKEDSLQEAHGMNKAPSATKL